MTDPIQVQDSQSAAVADSADQERIRDDNKKPPKKSLYVGFRPHPAMEALKMIFLGICCMLVIGPFIMVVSTSLADAEQIGRGGGLVLWPQNPSLESYRAILGGGQVTRALGVSVTITVGGTALALAFTSMLAYALSRRTMLFNRAILMGVLLTMLFSAGLIPNYLTIKQFGLLDSLWSLVLPVSVSAFNCIVMRQFFMNLPQELTEAAIVDGASEFRIFWNIILPLSKPIMAAIGLFYAVAFWNTFFSALLYINDAAKWPIQLILRQYLVNNAQLGVNEIDLAGEIPPPQPSLQMAILVVSLVPIVIVYPFLQRHFVKGMLTGAVKG
ncbi:carbohydrate ABC transporter permease [Propionibacteriaceae bacterium Y2011]|uniref:carbohydrate ABC transporter permease n=1 Tax=Microlunatus sp. Y2014 TaxID=3418488 RepID=UPI003B4D2033